MKIHQLSPDARARLGVALDGYAVTMDHVVLGLGETEIEAVCDARRSVGSLLPGEAVLSPITAAGRARVMDWGAQVASLRFARGILATRQEALAILAVQSWFEGQTAA